MQQGGKAELTPVSDHRQHEEEVYQFILDQIESVPHLEALLLLWNSRPQPWTVENLAHRLYVSPDFVGALLQDLVRKRLVSIVSRVPVGYRYKIGFH